MHVSPLSGFFYHSGSLSRVPCAEQQALTLYLFYVKSCLGGWTWAAHSALASVSGQARNRWREHTIFRFSWVTAQTCLFLNSPFPAFLAVVLFSWPHCASRDLSSLTGDGTRASAVEALPSHWTTRETPFLHLPRSHLGLNPGSASYQPGDVRTLVSVLNNKTSSLKLSKGSERCKLLCDRARWLLSHKSPTSLWSRRHKPGDHSLLIHFRVTWTEASDYIRFELQSTSVPGVLLHLKCVFSHSPVLGEHRNRY